jgi:galacturonosyltransferase
MAKILVLSNNDVGLYKFRKELLQELINQGNEICISLPYGDMINPLIDMGCKFIDTEVDRRGVNPFTDFKLLLKYYNIIVNQEPDLVITYTVKPNIYGGMICRMKKVPCAINITGLGTAFQKEGLLKRIIISLYKISCKKARVVYFENKGNQNVFIRSKIVKKEQTCKLNGAGVNLDEYKLSKYPDNIGEIRFLFIGRVMKEKGVDELFEAAQKIKKEYDNVVFDVVGPMEDNYIEIIRNLEDGNIIHYYGYQSDIKPFIERSNCFVLPSYHEGMANTLLEAGAMGRPLITSDIYGCKEAVIDGKTGYLVKVKDSEDLYVRLKQFIDLPYELKVKMGINSYIDIQKKFDKNVVIEKTIDRLIS